MSAIGAEKKASRGRKGVETPPVVITARAVAKAKHFAGTMQGAEGKAFRVFAELGGCSGIRYGFGFDDPGEGDTSFVVDSLTIVIDPLSADRMRSSTIDWIEDERGQGFTVENPNAPGCEGCHC